MSITAKSNLSYEEIRQLEAQLLARGYRQTSTYPSSMEVREYSVNTHRENRGSTRLSPAMQRYSICWRS